MGQDDNRLRGEAMVELVTESDLAAVRIVSLPPQRRRTLESVVSWGSPIRVREMIPILGRAKEWIIYDLNQLCSIGLVSRSGRGPNVTYRAAVGLQNLLDRYPSLGNVGRQSGHWQGIAILVAARLLVVDDCWPSLDAVAGASNPPASVKSVRTWRGRLIRAGLWPDTSGLVRTATRSHDQKARAAFGKVAVHLAVVDDILQSNNNFYISHRNGKLDDLRSAGRGAIAMAAIPIAESPDPRAEAARVAEAAMRRENNHRRMADFGASEFFYSDRAMISPVDRSPRPDEMAIIREEWEAIQKIKGRLAS
jgi:hypothetical protein